MTTTLVILGGKGDLTSRYLVPALVELDQRGHLPADLQIVGTARAEFSTDEYRDHLRAGALDQEVDVDALARLLERVRYATADATDTASLAAIDLPDDGPLVFYLALPPAVFADTFHAIRALDLGSRVRLAIEKPFGEDRASAAELNAVLDRCFEADQVFRIDHFLGHPFTRRLPALRRSPLFAGIWDADHLESLRVVWDETVALEGRAGYYDETGALRDMVQNHLLQVLAVVAMDVEDDTDVPQRRLEVLRAITADPARSHRARYTEGAVNDDPVPSYVDEEDVEPDRETETLAEVEVRIDRPGWRDLPVHLRSGKAMGEDRRCVMLELRSGDRVVFGISPPAMHAEIGGVRFGGPIDSGDVSAYAAVLDDLLAGRQAWFVSGPEAEEQWRVVEPVIKSWTDGAPGLEEYPAGS